MTRVRPPPIDSRGIRKSYWQKESFRERERKNTDKWIVDSEAFS